MAGSRDDEGRAREYSIPVAPYGIKGYVLLTPDCTPLFREQEALDLWHKILGDHFPQKQAAHDCNSGATPLDGERLENFGIAAQILDMIAAANAELRRLDQALQAVHDAASLRAACRCSKVASAFQFLRCGTNRP